MSTWGMVIFAIGAIVYFLAKGKRAGLASFALFVAGAGLGLLIGAVAAYLMFDNLFRSIY